MLKVFLLLIFSLSLVAKSNQWYSKVDAKIEAGIYFPLLYGNIENIKGISDLSKDFGYNKARASFFSLEFQHDYNYLPNLYLSYFNMQDSKSITLTKTVKIADKEFNSDVFTTIDYQLFDATFYKDLHQNGYYFTLFGRRYFTGDLEFDVGLSIKLFRWHYEVRDLTDLSRRTAWINVDEFIPLPYIGMKYFLYDLLIYTNANALAFSRAKSNAYQAGIDYKVVGNLHLDASYIYEEFKVVEKEDTVEFKTTGYKFSFKYLF